ncbi:hypothetical protein [Microbacterium sp. 2FI]|uniref:hypothetical protein n=1 Tax=Microbacterium sp. 2FI TaxID=2502193 RepID=UPI0010F9DDD7|nr:hypothetical protein [Microbacterium sp. 2FI]
MPDLKITDVEIEQTVARLREASVAASAGFALDPTVTGSDAVAAALGDADALIEQLAVGLAGVAEEASADARLIGVALTDIDTRLAGSR